MTEQNMTPKELIEWLDNEIETEMQKPTEEIDMEFVNECEQLIDILMDNYHEYTDEDAEKYFAELEKKKNAKKANVFIRSKKILAASIAILIIFLGGFTIYASSPIIRDYIIKTLDLDLNQSITKDGITYTYKGMTIKYNSIDDLISAEGLNIFYPNTFAYDAKILKVLRDESENSTTFIFDNKNLNFGISHNISINLDQYTEADLYEYNNQIFYIFDSVDESIAYSLINEDLYTLGCKSKDQLIIMINSFNFEKIE